MSICLTTIIVPSLARTLRHTPLMPRPITSSHSKSCFILLARVFLQKVHTAGVCHSQCSRDAAAQRNLRDPLSLRPFHPPAASKPFTRVAIAHHCSVSIYHTNAALSFVP